MNEHTQDSRAADRIAAARRAGRRIEHLRAQLDAAQLERLTVVAELIADGHSHATIATFLGISKPRVGQLVAEARTAGLL